jgi:uncharacterized membrane protein YiaA
MVITILPQSFGKGNKHFEKNLLFSAKRGEGYSGLAVFVVMLLSIVSTLEVVAELPALVAITSAPWCTILLSKIVANITIGLYNYQLLDDFQMVARRGSRLLLSS